MSISIEELIATPKQEAALIKKGWVRRYQAELIPSFDAPDHRVVVSKSALSDNEVRDWAYQKAREMQDCKVWIDFCSYWYFPSQMTTGIDWRICYERRIVEYGMHISVLGCNDVMPEIPAGLHMGMYHLISAKRLCRALKIGADGKRVKKTVA